MALPSSTFPSQPQQQAWTPDLPGEILVQVCPFGIHDTVAPEPDADMSCRTCAITGMTLGHVQLREIHLIISKRYCHLVIVL